MTAENEGWEDILGPEKESPRPAARKISGPPPEEKPRKASGACSLLSDEGLAELDSYNKSLKDRPREEPDQPETKTGIDTVLAPDETPAGPGRPEESLTLDAPGPIQSPEPKKAVSENDNPDIEVGLFEGVSYEEYNRWEGLRKSNLWVLVEKTPAHYRYIEDHPEKFDFNHFKIGHASHTAVFEPHLFESEYVVRPATYTSSKGEEKPWSGNAKACKELLEEYEAQGVTVLTPEQFDQCRYIRDAVHGHPAARMIIEAAKKEVSIRWFDKTTGLLMKARLDLWVEDAGLIADLKTVGRSASPSLFGRDAYRYGYHYQMAMYFEGTKVVTQQEMDLPVLIAVEKDPPYCVACYNVEEHELTLGRIQWETTIQKVLECQKANSWPGYSQGIMSLVLPGYAGQELDATAG